MALTRTPPDVWIGEGLRALADGGPDSVRVELLAQKLGVSKGGFYWHFRDRSTFLDSLLDEWERASTGDTIDRVDAVEADCASRLRALFSIAATSDVLSRADLAIRLWARRDDAVAQRLARVDRTRAAYLRTLFSGICTSPEEVEARSMLSSALWIGSHLMASWKEEGYSRADIVDIAFRHLVMSEVIAPEPSDAVST